MMAHDGPAYLRVNRATICPRLPAKRPIPSRLLCCEWEAMRGDGRSMEAIAAMDVFGQSAYSHEELLAHYHLTACDIVDKARKMMA
ncbi:MAG: hypothetical protein RSA65_10505 [Clostridia bacterium]